MSKNDDAVTDIVRRTPADVLKAYTDMVTSIPLANDEDAEADIIGSILFGGDLENSHKRFEQTDAMQLLAEKFVIDSVIRREAGEGKGEGFYLQCQVRRDSGKGETVRWSTSSAACIAVIVRANLEGRIPGLLVKHVQALKETKAGNLPRHLEVLGQVDAILG